MSSGWHSTLTISHPDEILPIAKSSGRLREQLPFICHPDDLLHKQWVYWLIHAYDIGTRSHPKPPHYGPFVRESTRNAALWDWYCFVVRLNTLLINQSNRRWVQKLRYSSDVTVMSQRYIEQLTLIDIRRLWVNGEGNTVNFEKYSSFSAPISFGQLPVKSIKKRCWICRYSRFTDIEWASKKHFDSQVKPWAYLYRHGWLIT